MLSEIQTYLLADTGLNTKTGGKVWCDAVKQGAAAPYVVIKSFGGDASEYVGHLGDSFIAIVQVDCTGTDNAQAKEIAGIAYSRLREMVGIHGSIEVHEVTSRGPAQSGSFHQKDGSDIKSFFRTQDFEITYDLIP